MAERVKEVAGEEANKLKGLTKDAVRSKAYLYPIKVSTIGQCTYHHVL